MTIVHVSISSMNRQLSNVPRLSHQRTWPGRMVSADLARAIAKPFTTPTPDLHKVNKHTHSRHTLNAQVKDSIFLFFGVLWHFLVAFK